MFVENHVVQGGTMVSARSDRELSFGEIFRVQLGAAGEVIGCAAVGAVFGALGTFALSQVFEQQMFVVPSSEIAPSVQIEAAPEGVPDDLMPHEIVTVFGALLGSVTGVGLAVYRANEID